MNLEQQQRERIKPELNHLYYEDFRPDTIFCREHAFHHYILARMLGHEASIVGGNFSVHIDNTQTHHSDQRSDGTIVPDGHYWNRIDEHQPVDVSISFRQWLAPAKDIGLVFDSDRSESFKVIATTDESRYNDIKTTWSGTREIIYLRHCELQPSPDYLLADPYSFLIKPVPPLTHDHGPQIFDKITLHLYMIALGRRPPLFPSKPSFANALKSIKGAYKNAR